MAEVITIANQKGGVAKSTTANALGAGLTARGRNVLYVDMDAQGNLSYSMGIHNKAITTLEVLTETATAEEAIVTTKQGDIIPASPSLASAEVTLKGTGREYKLKEALEPIRSKYDFIIIDTPPALGTLTVNALTACDSVIIPAQADVFSLQGIGQLMQTIQTVKKYCNKELYVRGLLLTRYNKRAVIARDTTELIQDTAKELKTKLYKVKIRECVALKEAQANQQDIFTYSPKCNATEDYNTFIDEFLRII